MTSVCSGVTCPDGNCTGCRNGKTWCYDLRCQPYCQGCAMPPDHDHVVDVMTIIIIVLIVAAIFIVWFAYGPSWAEQHNDHQRAGVLVPSATMSTASTLSVYA